MPPRRRRVGEPLTPSFGRGPKLWGRRTGGTGPARPAVRGSWGSSSKMTGLCSCREFPAVTRPLAPPTRSTAARPPPTRSTSWGCGPSCGMSGSTTGRPSALASSWPTLLTNPYWVRTGAERWHSLGWTLNGPCDVMVVNSFLMPVLVPYAWIARSAARPAPPPAASASRPPRWSRTLSGCSHRCGRFRASAAPSFTGEL